MIHSRLESYDFAAQIISAVGTFAGGSNDVFDSTKDNNTNNNQKWSTTCLLQQRKRSHETQLIEARRLERLYIQELEEYKVMQRRHLRRRSHLIAGTANENKTNDRNDDEADATPLLLSPSEMKEEKQKIVAKRIDAKKNKEKSKRKYKEAMLTRWGFVPLEILSEDEQSSTFVKENSE